MMPPISAAKRDGAVLPVLVILLVGLVGFVALALDLGMLAIAKNHAQNAADSAALAAVRTLNGDSAATGADGTADAFGLGQAPKNGMLAAKENRILGDPVDCDPDNITAGSNDTYTSNKVTIEIGSYVYVYNDSNAASEKFEIRFPRGKDADNVDDNYGAVRATVEYEGNFAFAKIWTSGPFNVKAVAEAVHRPRDNVIIMDMSGSMRFQSLPATPMSNSTTAFPNANDTARTKSLNPETVFPKFGHYSDETTAALKGNTAFPTTSGEFVDPANITVETDGGPAIADCFYADTSATATPSVKAFTKASDGFQDTPGGDNYLQVGGSPGKTVQEIRTPTANKKDTAWETDGYQASGLAGSFSGYTQGPRYWGKTFWIWPPDPRGPTAGLPADDTYADNGAKDWRQRFFVRVTSSSSMSGTTAAAYNAGTFRVQVNGIGTTQPNEGDTLTFNGDGTVYTVAHRYATATSGQTVVLLNKPLAADLSSGTSATFRATGWVDDNSLLYTSGGAIRGAGSNNTLSINGTNTYYRPNYAAILKWLRTDPKPFPEQLRAGRIAYYTAIPDPTSDTGLNTRWWTTNLTATDQSTRNQRFWREYIDFVLGIRWTGNNTWSTFAANNGSIPLSQKIGNGDLYTFGTTQISNKPILSTTTAYTPSSARVRSGLGYVTNPSGSNDYTNLTRTEDTSYIQLANLTESPAIGDYVLIEGDSRFYVIPNHDNAIKPISSGGSTYYGIKLDRTLFAAIPNSGTTDVSLRQLRNMNYTDNPRRPRHQYWFGAMTFVDFLGNYNTNQFWIPGTAPEAQCWACKAGIQTAIQDIRKNHPNDFVSLAYYNDPKGSATDAGRHNRAKVSLGQNYTKLINSLWFPPSVVNGTVTEISPYDADMDEVPRGVGGTCPIMGFMIAYNQLATNTDSLRKYAQAQPKYKGDAGGMGRKGAYKMIIHETDGAPNVNATASFHSSGGDYYYPIRIKHPEDIGHTDNEFPSQPSYSFNDLQNVVTQICKNEDQGGYTTTRRKMLVHCIAYGTLFETGNAGTTQTNALNAMQTLQFIGNTATTGTGSDFPTYKRIYGTSTERVTKMKDAFTAIMQDGVQVTLVR